MSAFVFRVFLGATLALTSPVLATEGGGEGGDSSYGGGSGGGGLSSATTKKVVKILKRDFYRCKALQPVYRYDCYRQTYRLAANVLNGRPAYAEALRALIMVEDSLQQVVATNSDPVQRPIRRGLQTYQPIKPAALPRAKSATGKALQQAETILLRAPETKQLHYARIAEAVNSNKVLLRSMLTPGALLRFARLVLHHVLPTSV